MFKLRTKPTQFTKGKTEDTLCDLTQRYLLNVNETEYHLIDIIVTNKSLPETEQWKIRTDNTFKNFKNITIDILSSKSDYYNTIGSYIQNILTSADTDVCLAKHDDNKELMPYWERREDFMKKYSYIINEIKEEIEKN